LAKTTPGACWHKKVLLLGKERKSVGIEILPNATQKKTVEMEQQRNQRNPRHCHLMNWEVGVATEGKKGPLPIRWQSIGVLHGGESVRSKKNFIAGVG